MKIKAPPNHTAQTSYRLWESNMLLIKTWHHCFNTWKLTNSPKLEMCDMLQKKTIHRNFNPRSHVVDLSFIVIFYAKSSMRYVLIIWLFFRICWEFSLLIFSKAGFKKSLNTRKPFKNNIKWKTKQSWKGNVWKYLFVFPIFLTCGRK